MLTTPVRMQLMFSNSCIFWMNSSVHTLIIWKKMLSHILRVTAL